MSRARSHRFQTYNKRNLNKLNNVKINNFSGTHQKAEVARVANTLKSGEFREKPKQGFKRGQKRGTTGKPEAPTASANMKYSPTCCQSHKNPL